MNNGKIRIYELSKELNLDNKDIKDICEQLNIAVKSHSSTITAAQADRVKSAAVKYTPAEKANGSNGSSSKTKENKLRKPKVKRKQQVLAVHHKQNSSESAFQAKKGESASPQLVSPPKLPTPPKAKTTENQTADRERATQAAALANPLSSKSHHNLKQPLKNLLLKPKSGRP